MAGSIKYFKYTTTGGTDYGIRMDESNGIAVGNTDVVAADLPLQELPKNITPRYVLYRSANGLTTRKIPVTANNVDVTDLPATITVASPIVAAAGIVLNRQSFVGEIQRSVINLDTAQDDGTVE
jgi:hypothetical protein